MGEEQPSELAQLLAQGQAFHRNGDFAQAEKTYGEILRLTPDHFEANHLLGIVRYRQGRAAEALELYGRAVAIQPQHVDAWYDRGVLLYELRRYDEALASFDRALAIRPDHVRALSNRGAALRALKRPHEALASYDKALKINPGLVFVLNNRGNILQDLKLFDEALASFDQALALQPDYVVALNNRGIALRELKRFDEALASCDRALAIKPDHAEALNSRGNVLRELGRREEALVCYERALAIDPAHAEAHYNRGNAFRDINRLEEAVACYERALAIKPDHPYALAELAHAASRACDWSRTATLALDLDAHVAASQSIVSPFIKLGYGGDPSLQRKCAAAFLEQRIPAVGLPPRPAGGRAHERLRIAYVSGDFRVHAVGLQMAELFERHDRSRFEVYGVSFGPDDGSEIRKRLARAFDRFDDVHSVSDREVARMLREREVDIAIDLSGHTANSRPAIFAHRAAPIQVNYFGYPGTTGADFIDYVIADKTVLPFDQQAFYSEKIVHLPDTYFVNDTKKPIAPRVPSRGEAGLPDGAFVFCCFNHSYKWTASVFGVWMRLLKRVAGSVLWLSHDNDTASAHLRREAQAHGIDPARIVFAPKLPRLDEHLARHGVADLFLDTLPYNAHATAADALWAGLPLVTCQGGTFADRVASSLLQAIGLPELIARGLNEYESLAHRLATDAAQLRDIRDRLARNRLKLPLFDTDRYRRHIEAAYVTMWQCQERGEDPQGFSVEPIGP